MLVALDLTQRQMQRVLEQALRTRPTLELETRTRPDAGILCGRLSERRDNLLHVQINDRRCDAPLCALVGAFCDVRIAVGGEMYLFTTCIVDVDEESAPRRVSLATPQSMQVANRRKFMRRRFRQKTEVRISAEEFDEPLVTELCDVGGDGLACRGPRADLDTLLVGDPVLIEFDLPGVSETFNLTATVCSKTPADGREYLILGVEFQTPLGDDDSRQAVDRLRELLIRDATDLSPLEGDA